MAPGTRFHPGLDSTFWVLSRQDFGLNKVKVPDTATRGRHGSLPKLLGQIARTGSWSEALGGSVAYLEVVRRMEDLSEGRAGQGGESQPEEEKRKCVSER